jgi:hypothetical protein
MNQTRATLFSLVCALFCLPPLSDGQDQSPLSASRPGASGQACVMVAVQDEKGSVIPGFEADRCVIRNADRRDILLKWGEVSARQLAGKTIRLRFFLRSANIYAVTAGNNL